MSRIGIWYFWFCILYLMPSSWLKGMGSFSNWRRGAGEKTRGKLTWVFTFTDCKLSCIAFERVGNMIYINMIENVWLDDEHCSMGRSSWRVQSTFITCKLSCTLHIEHCTRFELCRIENLWLDDDHVEVADNLFAILCNQFCLFDQMMIRWR